MDLTTTDKVMIGGGVALLVGGGVLWYVNSKKNKQDELASDQQFVDAGTGGNTTTTTQKKLPAGTTPAQKEAIAQIAGRQPDTVRFYKGDVLIANSVNGVKTYKVEKTGLYSYKNAGSVAATFKIGDEIGKVIWVGDNKDGTFRYVCERNGMFLNTLYWVTDASVVLKKATLALNPASKNPLNLYLTLSKGSKGKEVEALQKNLGFVTKEFARTARFKTAGFATAPNIIDGDFGQKTETALFNKYGLKSIKLTQLK